MTSSQRCHWYGGCGQSKAADQFYIEAKGLCIPCAEAMAKNFEAPIDCLHIVSLAIECGIKAEKVSHAKAMGISTEHAAAGTLRLDSFSPGSRESVRRRGMKSLLGAMIKLTKEEPTNFERAREIHAKYQAWIDKQYRV